MDMAPMILIMTPILLPVVTNLGMDPVHFGIILILNAGIGLLTPPVGTVLFVGSAIGKVSIQEATKAMLPFFYALIVVLSDFIERIPLLQFRHGRSPEISSGVNFNFAQQKIFCSALILV